MTKFGRRRVGCLTATAVLLLAFAESGCTHKSAAFADVCRTALHHVATGGDSASTKLAATFPSTAGKLVPWTGGGEFIAEESKPPPDSAAAVCVFAGDFGPIEGPSLTSAASPRPHWHALSFVVTADGSVFGNIGYFGTPEQAVPSPPPR
jgi:hypothetical protein